MGYPRSHLVDPATPGVYHCISRCVRRAFLCGVDKLTQRSFEHRRQLIEDRIHLLASQFSVCVHAYAVMSNHVHLVIATDPALPKTWSDDEVHARWRHVMPVRAIKPLQDDNAADSAVEEPPPQPSPVDIARWRERLGSLSWFMRLLLEKIARDANREDECTGHFWESRFFCQALLDERAMLAGCIDVDLNPHRAGIGRSLEALPHTGIALRIAAEKRAQEALTPRRSEDVAADPSARPPSTQPRATLAPVAGHNRLSDCLAISTTQYLALAAWTAGIAIHAGPSQPTADQQAFALTTLRQVLDCDPGEWLGQLTAIRERWRIAGGSEKEREWLERRQQRWIRKPLRRADASPGAACRNVSTFSDSADEFFYVMTVGSVSSVDVVLAVKAPGRCSRLAAVSVLSPSRGLIATEAGGRLAFGGPLM